MEKNNKELLITHLFDATTDVVFKAWTDPEMLKYWYAPDGCSIEFKSITVILLTIYNLLQGFLFNITIQLSNYL